MTTIDYEPEQSRRPYFLQFLFELIMMSLGVLCILGYALTKDVGILEWFIIPMTLLGGAYLFAYWWMAKPEKTTFVQWP